MPFWHRYRSEAAGCIPSARAVRLRVEALEDRRMLTVAGHPGLLDASHDLDADHSAVELSSDFAATDDHGNDAGSATQITLNQSVAGDIEVSGDSDWFEFTAQASFQYQIATTAGTLTDTVLRLIGTDGTTELDDDDDGGPGRLSLINWTATASATFYVEATGFENDTGTYGVSVTESPPADDHGDDAGSATQLSLGQSEPGDIEISGDVDWFKFTAQADYQYQLETSAGTLTDTVLRLIASDGTTELDSDDDSGTGDLSLINWTAPSSGTYYAEVAGDGSLTGTYGVSVSESPPADDHGNDAGSATPIATNLSVAGNIGMSGDDDWFSFTAQAGHDYEIATAEVTLDDTVLRLIDTDGTTQIDEDDDGGPSRLSLINWNATSGGTYYVEVTGFGNDTGTYELTITDPTATNVVGRHIFYHQDANPIAQGKSVLLPEQTISAVNVIGYTHGINGLFIDINGVGDAANLDATDFIVRTGSGGDPSTWTEQDNIDDVSVQEGAGDGGSDRVMVTWLDGTLTNTYVQLTVLANGQTGLTDPDVFYAASWVGDATGDRKIDAADLARVLANWGAGTLPEQGNFDLTGATGAVDLAQLFTSGGVPLADFTAPGIIAPPDPAQAASSLIVQAIGPQSETDAITGPIQFPQEVASAETGRRLFRRIGRSFSHDAQPTDRQLTDRHRLARQQAVDQVHEGEFLDMDTEWRRARRRRVSD